MTAEQTAGVALKLGGEAAFDSFAANGDDTLIGKHTQLTVSQLNGALSLKQTQGWLARDYVRLPQGAVYTVTEAGDAFGRYGTDESVRIFGLGIDVAGATVILDTRLGARLLFNQAEVDRIGSEFRVEVKLGETELLSADYTSLIPYRGYYSLVVNGIGIPDYATDFTVSGQAALVISMEDLVNLGQEFWSDQWLDLCNALENLHNVYNLDQSGAYTPDAVADGMTALRGDAGSQIYSAKASLLMSDAAGVRLDLVLRVKPENLNVTVNGISVADCATVTETPLGPATGYSVCIDLFFKAAAMEKPFEIVVSSDAGTYMTYGDTVSNLAYKLANDTQNEYRHNAQALLYYIQKACDCVSAL